MTINEVITRCDNLKPNQYCVEDKIRWISDLDGIIKKELIDAHEGGEAITFSGYDSASDRDAELLAGDPYSELYIKYLFAQIDFHNAEFTRYNNSMIMFNVAYAAYADYYNRTVLPRQQNALSI